MHPLKNIDAALRRLAGAVRNAGHRRCAGRECEALLNRAIAELEDLNRSTERDFLAIGGKLLEFVSAARQISSGMAALSEAISGACGAQASQVLTRVLERCRQTESQAQAGDAALAQVCEQTRTIGLTFRGFRETVSVFRVLGSLTRIETARLGNAGAEFGTLAEEVNLLTQRVETSGEGILSGAAALHRDMKAALARLVEFRAGELQKLPSLLSEVTASLGTLQRQHQKAMEVSLEQAAEYREISAAIEDLITAIQFHDITRQQIEHVADALKGMRGQASDHPPAVRQTVLKLQSSQLSRARQVFMSSVERIDLDLSDIGRRIGNMADAGTALMGASAEEHGSDFVRLEAGFKTISQTVASCARAEVETRAALGNMEAAVDRMRVAVAEVRYIGICIQRTATNATIRAVQIGEAGHALHVIADVMQRLAVNFATMSEQASESLDAMNGAERRLSEQSNWITETNAGRPDAVLEAMDSALSELDSATERTLEQLNRIGEVSARLRSDIDAVRGGISANCLLTESIERVNRIFEQLGMRDPIDSVEQSPNHSRHLEHLAATYTMAAERDVHASVLAGEQEPAVATTAEHDMGDNVELF